jgi:hypothetical protein
VEKKAFDNQRPKRIDWTRDAPVFNESASDNFNALQPPTFYNWNKWNKMTDFLVPNHRSKTI